MEQIQTANEALKAQVEREVAHLVSPPQAIEVYCDQGSVILDGPIYRDEAEHLLKAVGLIEGVKKIENRLDLKDRE